MSVSEGSPLRVMLVDDEPRVLRGLYRSMYQRTDVELHLAGNGAEALALLASRPFDVVISDFRMPNMDGVELLTRVRSEQPEVVRVMLSGATDNAGVRGAAVVHQFLSKPCDPETLTAALESVAALPFLANAEVRQALGALTSLPSARITWRTLQDVLEDPGVSGEDVAAIVSRDVALAAKVLQVANSAITGSKRTVAGVREAVKLLGVGLVRSLVLSADMFRPFEHPRVTAFSVEALSAHGQARAKIAQGIPREAEARAAAGTAALLQDVGQLALAEALPNRMSDVWAAARLWRAPLHVVERDKLGCTHADVGAYLLRLWGLPEVIVHAVGASLDPLDVVSDPPSVDQAVRMAHAAVQSPQTTACNATDARHAAVWRAHVAAPAQTVPVTAGSVGLIRPV